MEKDEKLEKEKDKESRKDKVVSWKTILFKRFVSFIKQRVFWEAFLIAAVVALSPPMTDVIIVFVVAYGLLRMEVMRNETRNTK